MSYEPVAMPDGKYDLEGRTLKFGRDVRDFTRMVPQKPFLYEDLKQLVRSSGSVGANYIEANDALSRKDFAMRIKISRKEAKESRYWLQMIDIEDETLAKTKNTLADEARQLAAIFGAILKKCAISDD